MSQIIQKWAHMMQRGYDTWGKGELSPSLNTMFSVIDLPPLELPWRACAQSMLTMAPVCDMFRSYYFCGNGDEN